MTAPRTTATLASGTGYTIVAGEYEADIASVGATLRSLRYRGRDLILPFDAEEVRPAMQGAVLAPWPNRLADGTYEFDGVVHNLPLTEPATATAAHGLVAWLDFTPVEQSADRLVLRARVEPQPGYPWRVRIDVVFELTEGGFRQIVTATNESAERAPIGLGVHPYLLAGGGDEQGHPVGALDDWRLTLPAREVMLVSEDRMLPVGMARVDEHDAGALDFRHGRRIGSTQLNHAFTALEPDPDGWATIAVENAQGSGVELWWNARAPWVQVYSSDYQPPATRRQGIAIEPMTCPPDAFNSRVDLRVVPGGSDTSLEWGSRAI